MVCMNDTQQDPAGPDGSTNDESPDGTQQPDFDPQRVRTILEMKRSRDDRMVAGVCSGAARYLNIDPLILRVLIGTLTFVGLAGVIVYVAAWILLPEEDTGRSVAQDHLGVGDNEPQIRTVGLIIAGIIAVVSGFGMIGGNALDTPFPYLGLAALGVFWFFAIRPHQARMKEQNEARRRTGAGWSERLGPNGPLGASGPLGPQGPLPGPSQWRPEPPNPRHDSGRLTLLTLLSSMVATGAVGIYAATTGALDWAVYPAVALGVIGVGMILGTFFGNGRPLIFPGILAVMALAFCVAIPNGPIGDFAPTPMSASAVEKDYDVGVGGITLDLTQVADIDQLDGRTVAVNEGIGDLRVNVPVGLDVEVSAKTTAGQIEIFDQLVSGDRVSLTHSDPPGTAPRIRLVLEQTAGQIKVNRQ